MPLQFAHACIYVLDQDSAKAFYAEKLGFEVTADFSMEGFRWLTVASPGSDVNIILAPASVPMLDEADAEALRRLIAKGAIGTGTIRTDNCRATYEELKAKGVVFTQEPTDRPYAIEALFRDDSGNWFSLTEMKPFTP